ncbi:Bacillopeptidase F [Orchesella cincta]|uniref:Bacillopeptidase F n=1 Tax=Orchesella cincta TaxID=48709 RepID=A0A1D2MR51_ORCCI|nr:Bacillopeptidase F [Orchesella cincta]
MKLLISILCVTAVLAAPNLKHEKLSPELRAAVESKAPFNYSLIIYFEGGTRSVLDFILATRFPTREERLDTLHTMLIANAESSQKNALAIASKYEFFYESFWITNSLYIRDVTDLDLVFDLEMLEETGEIWEEDIANLVEPVENKNASLSADYEWGIIKIQAPEAWDAIEGKRGQGIRIATVDTGVRGTHEALRNNYLGEYGWFDPSTAEPLPTDRNVFAFYYIDLFFVLSSVAPDAKWMACRGCATSACSQYDLNMCGQFFACPTLADGSKPDCSKAPHVVSNSWGGGRGTTCLGSGGIVPVFSIGNSGPRCDTANSPGDNGKVIGVGSTMESDSISSFSSVGPTVDKRMKPDIAAPGSEVISAYHTSDDAYRSLSGTSMAAPHVSGVVALFLTRNEQLDVANVKDLL